MGLQTLSLLWLLPATVLSGVLRDMDEEPYTCKTSIEGSMIQVDCSDGGLTELPNDLNVDAKVILLGNNNFITFPPALESFISVEILDLSGNRLTGSIPSYVQNWTSLRILNLSNNNYDSWLNSEYTFRFRRLDLSKNKINHIDEDAFIRMPWLTSLDLSENRIYNLPNRIFEGASNLEVLILSRNYISEVPNFYSASLKNLFMSSCQITRFDVNSLNQMQSLLELDLSINQIESIPDNLSSISLQELDLSYNEIDRLTDFTFSSLPHLAVLDLRGNEFREVWSTSHFASNPFLREVRLKGNRWACEGFSVNLLLTYEFLTREPSKVYDREALICYSPTNVTQMSWQQAYIRTWHSDGDAMSSYTFMAVMIGMIIGVVLTSFVCRLLISLNRSEDTRPSPETTVLNGTPAQRPESLVMRVPLREDLPPTYDEALLLPRLNSSFHSLPDIVEEDNDRDRGHRRSRSIGDLTENRPRGDRRSVRRTVEIRIH